MAVVELTRIAVQEEFGQLVGVSRQRVGQLVAAGVLPPGGTVGVWVLAYCASLRDVVAERGAGDLGDLNLVQERAALAREQRAAYAIKNADLRQEYAPLELLQSVLAAVSAAVVERIDRLPEQLQRACPGLPGPAARSIEATVLGARNEWVRATSHLSVERLNFEEADALFVEGEESLQSEASLVDASSG